MDEPGVKRRLASAPWWAVAAVAVAFLMLLALVAAGARGLPGRESRPPPFLIDVDLGFAFQVMAGVALGLVAVAMILVLLLGGSGLELPERKKASPWRILAGFAVVFAAVLILQPFLEQLGFPAALSGTGDQSAALDGASQQQSGSRWALAILGGSVVLIVMAAVAMRRAFADVEQPEGVPPPVHVTGVIDDVLAELEGSTDPREVVIGAYARMERGLTDAGLPPHASEAPYEYLARSLRHLRVSHSAITRLTELFEIARFSNHDVHSQLAEEAIAALNEIKAELTGVTT